MGQGHTSDATGRFTAVNPFTSGRWVMEPKPQNFWGVNHATWFTLMGVGGALFIWRVLSGSVMGRAVGMSIADLTSLVVIGVGGLILLADLGRPLQAWRVYKNPRTSWISLGFIADMTFLLFAGLLTIADLELAGARPLAGLPWAGDGALRVAFFTVASLAALVVIAYPGIVMASTPAIPFWNNMLIPAQFLAFGFASAIGVELLAPLWLSVAPETLTRLAGSGAVAVAAAGALLLLHALNGVYAGTAARASVARLASGDLRTPFYGALVLGIAVPAAALAAASLASAGAALTALVVLAAASLQVGNWLAKYAVIKAGVYPPFL
ncbi:MAG TPA: NrfD/PsrC family molybdoenzyme membrane anchor subunit [Candidatus Limnocylindria bacterium]|nr:NrfD/PsrC family molybdoenzyme membrane anchor subunit [Candidatus Limnocylindria bacterium]